MNLMFSVEKNMFKDHFKEILSVSGGVPTTEELDLLKESWERVDLVVRAPWIVLGILAVYGIIPYLFFHHSSADIAPINTLHCIVPIVAWSFVTIYNAFFPYFLPEICKYPAAQSDPAASRPALRDGCSSFQRGKRFPVLDDVYGPDARGRIDYGESVDIYAIALGGEPSHMEGSLRSNIRH